MADGTPPVKEYAAEKINFGQPKSLPDLEGTRDLHLDDDGKPRRTGTTWTAAAHIITAVIGSGVLSIPWSVAQMGWIAGPLMIVFFASCTLFTSRLLADCYRHPNPDSGKRNYTYMDAVGANLSRVSCWLCGMTQYSNLVGASIGYTITSATAARAIQKMDCYHRTGGHGECLASTTPYIAIYGGIQIALSMIPNFGELWWLSYLAAIMSFTYSFVVLGLGIGKSTTSQDHGSLGGIKIGDTDVHGYEKLHDKVFNIYIAMGNIAFAYTFSMILLEIQDTLRSPPSERKQMKRAALYAIVTTTMFYVASGTTGYLAFGNEVCGNILTCFTSPYWLVNFANTCVIIHLVGAYQVFTQPVFSAVETAVQNRFPDNRVINTGFLIRLPGRLVLDLNILRATWRTVYVIITTLISMVLPFFNDILGILGALAFWPLTIYFPIAIYKAQNKIPKWSAEWIGLHILSGVTFLVSLVALLGSIQGLVTSLRHVKFFAAT
ncbi:unnamed protein product [Calypogeia fissa]